MSLQLIIGMICITAIVVVALGLGYDGAMATAATTALAGFLTWQGKKAADRRGKNTEAVEAALTKAGHDVDFIKEIIESIKGGK